MNLRPWLAVPLLTSLSFPCLAEPSHAQANAGIDLGAAAVGLNDQVWQRTNFHLGARGDILYGRSTWTDWGVGPMLGVSTNGFHDLDVAAGVSLLAPVNEFLPLVLSVGPYVRDGDKVSPGGFGTIFWGARSYNYEGTYSVAAGLLLEGRYGLGDARERTIILAVHIDAELLAIPALVFFNALR